MMQLNFKHFAKIIVKIAYCYSFILILSFSSCKMYYPNQMFKQGEYQYYNFENINFEQYIIQSGDLLGLRVYSRNGFKLIDVLGTGGMWDQDNSERDGNSEDESLTSTIRRSSNTSSGRVLNTVTFLVDEEGFVKLPILGNMYVRGYSEPEIEKILIEKYASLFVEPFVILKVMNRRVLVFKGSTASVVYLNEAPTNLLEIIANSGGLDRTLKAYRIKVIRGDLKNPEIKLIDLSTIEGLRSADLIVQSNDVIYVEEQRKVFLDTFRELSPMISLLTTAIGVFLLINNVSAK